MSKAKEERNKAIKFRWEHDKDKRGIQVLMARQYGISKQAINVICHRKDSQDTPQTYSNGFLSFLWRYLMGCLFGR